MMYSMEKCLGQNGTASPEETDLFAGGREGLGHQGVPSDDGALVSAVAAVSHEIGDILKDELGDAECADRIGAELADLSAELGLLAGLADGDAQQDFPSLLKIAMGGECDSSGSSSSSSWSRARRPPRVATRPPRPTRRRPIAKVRRGSAATRRVGGSAGAAARRTDRRSGALSDASDVGADCDSDDQWTELDGSLSPSGSGSGSSSEDNSSKSGTEMHDPFRPDPAEPPQLRQFLLPLISNVPNSAQFRIRHDDIVQLLATEEDVHNLPDLPVLKKVLMHQEPEPEPELSDAENSQFEEPLVTTEEEAALLHYVCGGERGSIATFQPTEEWLLGVFHSWCEVSALIYTLIGTDASASRVCGPWAYRVRVPCHCRLCVCSVRAEPALQCLLRDAVWALAHGGSTVPNAAYIMRALRLGGDMPLTPEEWDLPRLKRIQFSDEGAAIIHNQLVRYSQQNETARQIISQICNCREFDKPMEQQYAVERFIRILESYKEAAIVNFKVEMVSLDDDPETNEWLNTSREKLERYLQPYQASITAARIHYMATRTRPPRMSIWDGYQHSCECRTPKILCAQQRKLLLRSIYSKMSVFGLKHSSNECVESELPIGPTPIASQRVLYTFLQMEAGLQQDNGTGAKPPESSKNEANVASASNVANASNVASASNVAGATSDASAPNVNERREPENAECGSGSENEQSDANADLDDSSFLTVTDSESGSNMPSLPLSSESSLDSASELLLVAAQAVDSDNEPAPTQLCRTVRHMMRSIASIERHMDTVLKQCDEWPTGGNDIEARKQVDMGLSAVDRKLMAMYRRLPGVHNRQLQVYRKQKKLSTVCMQLVGGAAPAPPPPGTPPPPPHNLPCRALCPEYHLQRFKEVRRKVMHMRDQQLYYHRLRMWLEDQLKQEKESIPDSSVTLVGDMPRRKRRTDSPRHPTTTKRKPKPSTISKPHRILQLLKHKAQTTQLLKEGQDNEASPPEAFPLEKDDNISDADTIVGEKVDMNQVIASLAQMALNPDKRIQQVIAELREEYAKAKPTPTDSEEEYPESVSPPLQEMSPTSEPPPVFTPKPTQRLIKFSDKIDAQVMPELNVPLNALRTPVDGDKTESEVAVYKDPNIYKYVTFGLEIKKAMEECQNIINSYNSIKTEGKEKEVDHDGISLKQMCEVMMSLDKNSAEFLNKLDMDVPIDIDTANTKLAELVENMPQILANLPEIANEFANASFELPEFASIMNSLPDVNSEAQLTPETLKQIRDLKLSKNRDSVKVTKNTTKRKISRRIKSNSGDIGTFTFEFDSTDLKEMLKDEAEIKALLKIKLKRKEEYKDVLFTISAQIVIKKIFEYLRDTESPDLARCMADELFSVSKQISAEMLERAVELFETAIKDVLCMDELRDSVKSRFEAWKNYVTTQFKSIPVGLVEHEIENMLDKFYFYIRDFTGKPKQMDDKEKVVKKEEPTPKEDSTLNKELSEPEENLLTKESPKSATKMHYVKIGSTFDTLLMKMFKMPGDKRNVLKNMKINYVDVLKRCAESAQLVNWILSDPHVAATHIQELMGFNLHHDKAPDFSTMSIEKKRTFFMERLKAINRHFMDNIPRSSVTGDEWLVMLFKLEQFEIKIKEALVKLGPPVKTSQNASEAEILAAKGLSKIIGNNNVKVVKKPEPFSQSPASAPAPAPPAPLPAKVEEKPEITPTFKVCNPNDRREVVIKCETLIAQKANKPLKDSFDAIKSYLAGDATKPQNYHEHVMAIVSNLDYSALDEEMVEVLRFGGITISPPVPAVAQGNTIKVNLPAHCPEELAQYSALRNAKQTLNAVAFKNLSRNGQSKSESDISSCDVPSSECKYTSDCLCTACKRDRSICLGDIVKISFDPANPDKSKCVLEEKKKEVKEVKVKTPAKAKPMPKQCENAPHNQHVCKVGHTNSGNGSCTGDGNDQHCTCCYCTVFGHAPPLTTPVPRNFNETRERLRLILNKKKQLCKTANGEQVSQQDKQGSQPERKQVAVQPQASAAHANPPAKVVQPQPKPPALPKTLPPNLTAQAQAKRQALDNQQRMLADKMAKMVVTEKSEIKLGALQRTAPVQVNVPPSLKAEGKVNPNAMEQIRLQQLKQQQQAQFQQQVAQQKKPEPIYDLPIHNKPPQQQQLIRQEIQMQQAHKQMLLQHRLMQNQVLHINAQAQTQTPLPQAAPMQQSTPMQQPTPIQQQKPTLQPLLPQNLLQQVQQKPTAQPQFQQKPALQQVQQKLVLHQVPKPTLQQLQQQPSLHHIHNQVLQPGQSRPILHQVQQKPVLQQGQQKLVLQQVPRPTLQQLQQMPPQQVQQMLSHQQQQSQQKMFLQQQVQQKMNAQLQAQKAVPQPSNRVVQTMVHQNPSTQPAQPQQLLQKPPIQQAPRKPPPQELQQKLAQKQQPQNLQQRATATPPMKPVQPTPQQKPTPVQPAPTQQQLHQVQQQQLREEEQRQARQLNQTSVSLSSRDTSVFSTSSGCSDGSCWQGRAEDTRDLDALLQYIEGPTRHVDRGKKKAKKQRQKAKKTEERLSAECEQLKTELARVRFEAEALRVSHYSAKRRCEETRKALQVLSTQNAPSKSRKKQNKLNPVQKQQIQVLAEQVGELTALMNSTAKELQSAENQVAECSQQLRKCEKEILDARCVQLKKTPQQLAQQQLKRSQHEQIQEQLQEQKQLLLQEKLKLQQQDEAQRLQMKQQWLKQQELQERQKRQQEQLQEMQQLKQQRQLEMEHELINRARIDEAKLLKQRQNEAIANADRTKANGAISSSSSTAGSVSNTSADRGSSPASTGAAALPASNATHSDNRHLILAKHVEKEDRASPAPAQAQTQAKADAQRKPTQTWEQALAHINQVASGSKDKKKVKQPPAPVKPEPKSKETKPVETGPLSKKQRKKLAQQQAEEEERQLEEQLQKQEAKSKKKGDSRKSEAPALPAEPLTKKAEKKLEQAKRAEQAKSKKEAKRERKLEKKAEKKEEKKAEKKEEKKAKEKEIKETKEKENKYEKNVPVTAKQAKQAPPVVIPPPQTKKERKREQQKQQEHKPQVANITPHTTIELVNKKSASASEPDKPSSCSIMDQLSCGIQVSELRLPPGITLTRVHPNEKKEPPPIKSVPLWKANQLAAAPTPVARPVPVINADPAMMAFSTAHPEQPPKPIIVAEPPPISIGKSKKAKKKAKKAAAAAEDAKPDGTKMVTLRNPMFHPNLPPVQISSSSPPVINNPKKPEIRLPDPIPMPPNACQATITPTSNGMYTIRNPLMSMMHQQNIMGVRNPTPPFTQPQYNYPNPNSFNQPQYVDTARTSPKPDEYQNRIMNLASFTQQNDEGYSLFKTSDNPPISFLSPEYYGEETTPKPVVSPNPIGTRPEVNRPFESDNSLFAHNIQRPEPIGTPLKREDDLYTGLYNPFGVQNPNVFRNAVLDEKTDMKDDVMVNGDLPYFQRLRVGSKLNNEVTIHHVTESKFYRQEPSMPLDEIPTDDSLFSRPIAQVWADPIYTPNPVKQAPPRPSDDIEPRFGAVGTRPVKDNEPSIFLPEASIGNLSLEACEREIESFKRFEWYFSPPEHKPKVQLHVSDIANSMKK